LHVVSSETESEAPIGNTGNVWMNCVKEFSEGT